MDFFSRQPQALNALNLAPASRLLKLADNQTVYYANQSRLKMPIPSAQVFLSYGAKWGDIEIVEQSELDFYKDAEYIKFIGDAKIYQLKDGVKRYLTPQAASALKILPEEVVPVNKTEFKVYKNGAGMDEAEALDLRAQTDALALSQEQSQKCVPDPQVGGEDGCKIFEAMTKKDSSLCESVANQEWKAKCYTSVVPESGDYLSNCTKISNPNFKDDCVSQAALAKNNPSLCANILDAAKKQFCESGIKISRKDLTACESLAAGDAGTGKNTCWYNYAISNYDSRACEKISADSSFKKPCNDFLNQQLSMQKKLKPNWLTDASRKIFLLVWGKPAQAQVQDITNMPVGGKFLPGAFDIFTPTLTPPCLLVSVAGPNPGTFNWVPVRIYDYFPETFYHAGLNMLGLSKIVPPCPPTLFMLGSGLSSF